MTTQPGTEDATAVPTQNTSEAPANTSEAPANTSETPANTTAIAAPTKPALILSPERPAYLVGDTSTEGAEGLDRYIRPKYLKVAQPTGDFRRVNNLEEGDVMKMPIKEVFMTKSESRLITPVYHWTQWELWYEYKAKMKNPVKDRTLDPEHEIAQVCKGPSEFWKIPDPDHAGLDLTYKECICYVFYCHDSEELIAVNFSGGEHKTGRTFSEMCALRKARLYTTVFEMTVGEHSANGNTWMGFNFNPAGWIAQESLEEMRELYLKQKDAYERNLLFVDETEGVDTESMEEAEVNF